MSFPSGQCPEQPSGTYEKMNKKNFAHTINFQVKFVKSVEKYLHESSGLNLKFKSIDNKVCKKVMQM